MNCIENALTTTGWNAARVKLLARFLTTFIVCLSVCLPRLANSFAGNTQTSSHYKRLQRFLRGFDLDAVAVARLMLSWLQQGIALKPPYIVSLDHTNRKFSRTKINVLMLAIVYKCVAFPVLWSLLGKAGRAKSRRFLLNFSVQERQALLTRYLEAFDKDSIDYSCKRNVLHLTADREFGGKVFLSWLTEQEIDFVIRL